MFGFHEKRKFKNILYSKAVLIGMCIPVGLMSYATFNAYEKEQDTSMRRQELSVELQALEKRAGELEKNIENLEDPRGIEAELRSRYDIGWEGEEVIILVEEEGTEAKATETKQQETGFWKGLFSSE